MVRKIILVCGMVLVYSSLMGQNSGSSLSIGTIKTELKQTAINIGINYIRDLDSLFQTKDLFMANNNSLFQATPEFDVLTGGADAFSSITAKLTGLWMFFSDTTIAGFVTPNTSKMFHTLPVSMGIETNNNFNIINSLVEVGYVPWYQTIGNKKTPSWLKKTKFGIFLQAGYKFEIDTAGMSSLSGGSVDESNEEVNDPIFRAKASFAINTLKLVKLNNGMAVGVVGSADSWYNFLNSELFYRLKAKIRFYLTKKQFFDFIYQKGSGAPDFNKGDQYGIGLTIAF